jgi:hypothetical protein
VTFLDELIALQFALKAVSRGNEFSSRTENTYEGAFIVALDGQEESAGRCLRR